jgi:hypothetical protein
MPPPNLSVFTGNPLDWPTWKSAFETVIEKRAINPSEKILYLLQYLSGAPRKVVEGYQFVSSPDAYRTAKNILKKRFGHPSVVADVFRKRLENWQRIAPKDGTALREFADFLRTCKLAMHSVEDLETLNKENDNKKLVKIFPVWAHPKWGTKVRDYQPKHGDNKFPPFTVFVNFVTQIADIQCLPVLFIGRVCFSPLPGSNEDHGVWTNKIIIRELTSTYECGSPRCGTTFVLKSRVKEIFNPAQVNEMFELDFQERCRVKNERSLSVEDQKFLKILGDGIHKQENGHYEMPLPQRSSPLYVQYMILLD